MITEHASQLQIGLQVSTYEVDSLESDFEIYISLLHIAFVFL